MSRPIDPNGPDYGTTSLQFQVISTYLPATQAKPLPWPSDPRWRTSCRALVRRRLLSRTGTGHLFVSDKGRLAHKLKAAG